MRIIFGSDANGALQESALIEELHKLGDCSAIADLVTPLDDYIQVTAALCKEVLRSKCSGILLCGTGAGTAICANKHKGVYAVTCFDPEHARNARRINNANVICIAVSTPLEVNLEIIRVFLTTRYRGRKPQRIKAVRALERKQFK